MTDPKRGKLPSQSRVELTPVPVLILVASGANLLSALAVRSHGQHVMPEVLALVTSATVLIATTLALVGMRLLPSSHMLPSALVGVAILGPVLYPPLRSLRPLGVFLGGLALLAVVAASRRGVGSRWLTGLTGLATGAVLWCSAVILWKVAGGTGFPVAVAAPALLGGVGFAAAAISGSGRKIARATAAFVLVALVLAPATHAGWSWIQARVIERPEQHPNIVLLSLDALRADALTAELAPNMAQLRSSSLDFREARAAAPRTPPSVASILTGLSPLTHQTGLLNEVLPDEVDTLAERLGRAGYRTAAIVRNPYLSPQFGMSQGFDEYHYLPLDLGMSWGDMLLRAGRRVGAWPRDDTSLIAWMAGSWLASPPGSPYFLWIHFLDPHAPYSLPADLRPSGSPPAGMGFDWAPPAGDLAQELPEQARQWIKTLYRAEVRYVDRAAGRILSQLDKADFWSHGILVLTSDHGEELWEREAFGHGQSMHDELLRVPLMIRAPGLKPGVNSEPVSTESVVPRVLELAGLAGVSKLERSTLSSTFRGGSFHHALVMEGYKLIVSGDGDPTVYDLRNDPGERSPLAPDHEVVAELLEELSSRREEAEALRETLSIPVGRSAEPSERTLRDLRALGYIE